MSNFNNLWNNWYSKKVLTEMKAFTAKRVVAVAQSIKEKAGLEGLNDSYTRTAAFPEIFGDKLRIVVAATDDDLLVMAKYVAELEKLALQSLKDKVAKGFIKDDDMTYSAYFGHEQLLSKETKRRLQEDGGGTYEIEVIYHQPILVIEYINMQGQRKKENTSLLKAFNKFKMREAADYWANIQSRYTKDKQFIVNLVNDYSNLNRQRETQSGKAIVYSRAPIDVLRMSDHPMISSCHSQGGSFFKCAIQEAVRGGAIAYSVNKEDIQRIIDEDRLQDIEIFEDQERGVKGIATDARVRIRRMFDTDTKQEYALPEIRLYGYPPPSFGKNVLNWAVENQKSKFTNLETGEFQLPDIQNAIKVGGSYDDNIPFDLYERLAKQVAKSVGASEPKIEEFNISNVNVNEGMDLMSNCERGARLILDSIGLNDPTSMATIANYKVMCKSSNGIGVAASRAHPLFGEQPRIVDGVPDWSTNDVEDYNDEFVSVEIDYVYKFYPTSIRGIFNTELNSDLIKQIINKTQELAPYGPVYMVYKVLKIEELELEQAKDFGGAQTHFQTIRTLSFKTVDDLEKIKALIPNSQDAYFNYNNDYRTVLLKAGMELGLLDPEPFDNQYARRLYREINATDYMSFMDLAFYGKIITFYSPGMDSQFARTDKNRGQLKQPTLFNADATNQFLQGLRSFFFVYTIPKQNLRAALQLATKEAQPNADDRRAIEQKNTDIIAQLTKNINTICEKLAEDTKKKMGDRSITDFVRLEYQTNKPMIANKVDGTQYIRDDMMITFSLNIDLSTYIAIEDQETMLELVEYLYKNFYKFRDNLEIQLIDRLKESDNKYVKSLMSDAYIKGIKGEEPVAPPTAQISEESIPELTKQAIKPVIEKAQELWEKLNGKHNTGKAPFFAALIDYGSRENAAIRVYYAATHEFKRVKPLDEQIYYLDYEFVSKKSYYGDQLIIICPMIDRGTVNVVQLAGKAIEEVIDQAAESIVVNTSYSWHGYKTTIEKEGERLAGFDPNAEEERLEGYKEAWRQMNSPAPAKPIKPVTGLSGETSSNDERQMKMFERKVNKKLIRERLIKWYKRNS